MDFTTMWTFHTKQFRVEWSIALEDYPELDFDETGETQEKVNSGEWLCFCSRMTIYFDGDDIGTDYLGQSIYANRDHIGSRGKWGSYFKDMVSEAISEARDNLRKARPYIRANA